MFSGADLWRLVLVPERIHVVKSRDNSFMVVKTLEFDAMVVVRSTSFSNDAHPEPEA